MALPNAFPVRLVLGVYLGVLTGLFPALVSWALAVLFRYVTGLTVPSFAVVVLAAGLAGVNGGFMALSDPSIVGSQNNVTLVTALLVVMMMAFYAHNHGDAFGAALPRHISLRALRERTLSSDVVERVGGLGRARPRVVGPVGDIEGYPPLPADLQARVRAVDWMFPADLTLPEIESRFADRLRSEFDLAAVDVTLDERARAQVSAAPPASALSRRVPPGQRAVSVEALLPTGLVRGDEVRVFAGDAEVTGTVVSALSGDPADGTGAAGPPSTPDPSATAAGEDAATGEAPAGRAPATTGGQGRLTVAVERAAADALLRADEGRVLVTSRGTRREYELLAVLRRAGQRFKRVSVREGGPLDGTTIGAADLREVYGVAVLGVRADGEWTLAPGGGTPLGAGADLFVVGARGALDRFEEAVA